MAHVEEGNKDGNPDPTIHYEMTEGDKIDANAGSQVPVLPKSFNLLSACTTGITTGNTWALLGGSIVASLYNGGPPGIIYEFIVVTIFYCFIAASLAELASAFPTSGGVYYWASATAGSKYGRICAWFAGWLNALAWTFAIAGNTSIVSSMIIEAYTISHPELDPKNWHIFICYLIVSFSCCFIVMFGQPILAPISRLGTLLIITDLLIAIIVCAIMPGRRTDGAGYASNSLVWTEWQNKTGYSSNGFVFLAGMLNGAYSIGAIDCITHIAEEIPQAGKNLPKAMACQIITGFITGFCYLISILYAINDLPTIMASDSIAPLGNIYLQATGSKAGAIGLLVMNIAPILCTIVGTYITAGRTVYALGRDDVTPFSNKIGAISAKWQSPLWATFSCGIFLMCIGAIYIGSLTAFNAFIDSFVQLTTLSYLLAILPHLLRARRIRAGSFWMGSRFGPVVNAVACVYIVVTFVIYCFPYTLPPSVNSMNYASVIVCGLAVLVGIWWVIHGRGKYLGPQVIINDLY